MERDILQRIEDEHAEWMMCGKILACVYLGKAEMREFDAAFQGRLLVREPATQLYYRPIAHEAVRIVPTDAESEFRAEGE